MSDGYTPLGLATASEEPKLLVHFITDRNLLWNTYADSGTVPFSGMGMCPGYVCTGMVIMRAGTVFTVSVFI